MYVEKFMIHGKKMSTQRAMDFIKTEYKLKVKIKEQMSTFYIFWNNNLWLSEDYWVLNES